jgi:hypothetical protein
MDEGLKENIAKARDLWNNARHAAMATVNTDGSPHNTPFRFMRDPELKYIYWASYPEAVHSQNILRTGKIFVVLYDAIKVEKGGLYIAAEEGHALEGGELVKALAVNNELRAHEGKSQLALEYYSGGTAQKMWSAKITHFWINHPKRDANGQLNKDSRKEISVADLLAQN